MKEMNMNEVDKCKLRIWGDVCGWMKYVWIKKMYINKGDEDGWRTWVWMMKMNVNEGDEYKEIYECEWRKRIRIINVNEGDDVNEGDEYEKIYECE